MLIVKWRSDHGRVLLLHDKIFGLVLGSFKRKLTSSEIFGNQVDSAMYSSTAHLQHIARYIGQQLKAGHDLNRTRHGHTPPA